MSVRTISQPLLSISKYFQHSSKKCTNDGGIRGWSTAEFWSSATVYPSNSSSCNNTQSFVSLEPSFRRLVGKLSVFIRHLLHTELHQHNARDLMKFMRQARILASPAVHFAAVHISVLFAQAPCCEGVEVSVYTHPHILLTPVLGGDKFWSSHSGRFTAGVKPPVPLA